MSFTPLFDELARASGLQWRPLPNGHISVVLMVGTAPGTRPPGGGHAAPDTSTVSKPSSP